MNTAFSIRETASAVVIAECESIYTIFHHQAYSVRATWQMEDEWIHKSHKSHCNVTLRSKKKKTNSAIALGRCAPFFFVYGLFSSSSIDPLLTDEVNGANRMTQSVAEFSLESNHSKTIFWFLSRYSFCSSDAVYTIHTKHNQFWFDIRGGHLVTSIAFHLFF